MFNSGKLRLGSLNFHFIYFYISQFLKSKTMLWASEVAQQVKAFSLTT